MADTFENQMRLRGSPRFQTGHASDPHAPEWAGKYMEFLYRYHYRNVFPWRELPGELRNVIYQLLFVQDEPIRISQEFRTPIGYMLKVKLSSSNVTGTSLLKLNYETYLEASSVLYSENCFRFSTMDSLVQFLEPLTPRTRTCFRSIQLWTAYKSGKGVIRDITPAFCPPDPWLNLDRFELYHGIPDFSDPTLTFDGLARSLLNQSHLLAWLKAVGNAKGDPMAGTEILRLSDKILRGCCPNERHSEDLAEIFKKILADLLASPEYA